MLPLLLVMANSHLEVGDRFCGVGRYPDPLMAPEPAGSVGPALTPRDEWRPIRVALDISKIMIPASCLEEGNATASVEVCESANLLSSAQLSSLALTFSNMENFMSRLLKVSPEVSPIQSTTSTTLFDADLVIGVKLGSFGNEKILATAGPSGYSNQLGRANRGVMNINPVYVPTFSQDEHSLERLFFTVVFHEIMHVLGMVQGRWNSWIDSTTGEKYAYQIETSFEKYGKKYRILHTPRISKFMAERFGTEWFADGVPAGMEIEDGGGSGTAGSHPEGRVFMSEVSCGIFVGYVSISNLSLALLEDTGWYIADYSMGEPYAYGDGRSMDGERLPEFPVAPPQKAFPKHYLCRDYPMESTCHHDFRSKAYCSPSTKWNCGSQQSSDDRKACAMKEFVNPDGLEWRGDVEVFDYMYFKVGNVSERCEDVQLNELSVNVYTGEEYGASSMCAMATLSRAENATSINPRCYSMECTGTEEIKITIDGEVGVCREEGERITFPGFLGYLECPSPRLACGMREFLVNAYNQWNPVDTSSADPRRITPSDTPQATIQYREIVGLSITVITVFVAIAIVTVAAVLGGLAVFRLYRHDQRVNIFGQVDTDAVNSNADDREDSVDAALPKDIL